MTIRVLLADDHPVVSDGLRVLLEAQPDMEVVGVAQDGREAVALAKRLLPDVVVMDHAMPEMNGTEATRMIRARLRETRVVMLSMHANSVHACRAMQAGASGYVLKQASANQVVEAIRAVRAGRRYVSEPLADEMLNHLMSDAPGHPLDSLSARERQVLQMLAEGKSTSRIAVVLSLSPKTVDTYRARLMQKLELENAVALVRFAAQHRLISLE
jgi:DNA-binding NarL/FixJ family response regulator